jgi:hypothetical protein
MIFLIFDDSFSVVGGELIFESFYFSPAFEMLERVTMSYVIWLEKER